MKLPRSLGLQRLNLRVFVCNTVTSNILQNANGYRKLTARPRGLHANAICLQNDTAGFCNPLVHPMVPRARRAGVGDGLFCRVGARRAAHGLGAGPDRRRRCRAAGRSPAHGRQGSVRQQAPSAEQRGRTGRRSPGDGQGDGPGEGDHHRRIQGRMRLGLRPDPVPVGSPSHDRGQRPDRSAFLPHERRPQPVGGLQRVDRAERGGARHALWCDHGLPASHRRDGDALAGRG